MSKSAGSVLLESIEKSFDLMETARVRNESLEGGCRRGLSKKGGRVSK